MLLIWLPSWNLNLGAKLVPRPAQGFLHSAAYGVAILLGLTLFLCFRGFAGMKYNLPSRRDFRLALIGFVISAPVLIAVGIAIGFIPPPHLPTVGAGRMAAAIGLIFVGTALPEEILFRSLIQNFIMQRWGESARTLFLASFIFGCAHLDNGLQPLPNWRYMILATIAGVVYGKVFQEILQRHFVGHPAYVGGLDEALVVLNVGVIPPPDDFYTKEAASDGRASDKSTEARPSGSARAPRRFRTRRPICGHSVGGAIGFSRLAS